MSNPSDRPLRFGRFEISPAERLVRVEGHPVPLGARAFDVLMCLIERRDRLVSKREVLDTVWPGLVVEEHNIATQIGTLRKVLGAHTISTVPGRGYRFTAPIEEGAPSPLAAPTPQAVSRHAGPRLAPLIGRGEALDAVAGLLQRHRLVTLAGAGGIGKSLLARHVLAAQGSQWANGTGWIELANLTDAAMLPACIAEGVGVQLAGSDPIAALTAALSGLSLLLALDNAEYLAADVARIATALLEGAPGVRLLVTSQVPLHVAEEQVYRVEPLAVPPGPLPAARALAFASVALFVERARTADTHFEFDETQASDVIDICRRLDGLPLAIELAAARAPLLGARRLATMLDTRLRLLNHNRDTRAPARQRTLQTALEWSHGLLDEAEQRVFRRLAVIAGSASLDMVQQIAADGAGLDAWRVLDALGALVDRSLVTVLPGHAGTPRYRLLESPRALALEKLDAAGERVSMQRRHAQAVAALCTAAWDERQSGRVGVLEWENDIRLDAGNARDALAWACATDEPDIAVPIAATLFSATPRWSYLERMRLGDLCESLAERVTSLESRRRALLVAVRPMYHPSRARSLAVADLGVAVAREIDRNAPDRWALYESLCSWIYVHGSGAQPHLDGLRAALAEIETLEDPHWPPHRLFEGLEAHRVVRMAHDGPERPKELLLLLRRQLATLVAAGADAHDRTSLLMDAEIGCGNVAAAIELGERALATLAGSRDEWALMTVLGALVMALLAQDAPQKARPLLRQALDIGRRFRINHLIADMPALLAAVEGRPRAAARLAGHADAGYAARDITRYPNDVAARDRCVALARAALGDAVCDALIARGRTLSDDAAVELALAEIDLG